MARVAHCFAWLFLSTPSARRATFTMKEVSTISKNFYPRPPRGGRPDELGELITNREISIHALREEGDDFFPRILLASGSFLSTPSARRATLRHRDRVLHHAISIHALREEGDGRFVSPERQKGGFLSTPSARRATKELEKHTYIKTNFYPRPPRGGRRGDVRRRPVL